MALPTEPQHVFNSHPHKEDDDQLVPPVHSGCFSTHILTRRMTCHNVCDIFKHFFFNSHPHKEDDYIYELLETRHRIFNSHPHKEDDLRKSEVYEENGFFNSHPHKEDDCFMC